MATVTGLTKERMLEIEAASVVDGDVDESGNLILTKHDGSQFNAGHVVGPAAPNLADASTTVKGIAEIATLTEVATGTDTSRFVTPQGVRQERNYVDQYLGVIDSAWSTGMPTVTLDAAQAYSGTVTAYLPGNLDDSIVAGAKVLLTRSNSGAWIITSSVSTAPRFMRQIPCSLEPGSGWIMYSDPITADMAHLFGEGPSQFGNAALTNDSTRAGKFYVTCTTTGIATLSGLLVRPAGAPAIGSVVGRFPIALAPARNQLFSVYTDAGAGQFAVCTDGTIRYAMGTVAFITVSNLRWRTAASVTAGAATFVPITLLSGWGVMNNACFTGEPGSTVHTPGYTIDADKVAVFEGIYAATAAKVANSDVAVLSALTPQLGSHQGAATIASFGFARIGSSGGVFGSGNVLNSGNAFSIGQWMSLSNMLFLDSTSTTTIRNPCSGVNAWTLYAVNWSLPGFAKTPDGLVLAFGLWGAGTVGQAMTFIPEGWRPRFATLMATVSNAAVSRVDVGAPTNANYANQPVQASTGSNIWYSIDGISWPAYR